MSTIRNILPKYTCPKVSEEYPNYIRLFWNQPSLTSDTSYGKVTGSPLHVDSHFLYEAADGVVPTAADHYYLSNLTSNGYWNWQLEETITPYEIWFYNTYSAGGNKTKEYQVFADKEMKIPLTERETVPNVTGSLVKSKVINRVSTSNIYVALYTSYGGFVGIGELLIKAYSNNVLWYKNINSVTGQSNTSLGMDIAGLNNSCYSRIIFRPDDISEQNSYIVTLGNSVSVGFNNDGIFIETIEGTNIVAPVDKTTQIIEINNGNITLNKNIEINTEQTTYSTESINLFERSWDSTGNRGGDVCLRSIEIWDSELLETKIADIRPVKTKDSPKIGLIDFVSRKVEYAGSGDILEYVVQDNITVNGTSIDNTEYSNTFSSEQEFVSWWSLNKTNKKTVRVSSADPVLTDLTSFMDGFNSDPSPSTNLDLFDLNTSNVTSLAKLIRSTDNLHWLDLSYNNFDKLEDISELCRYSNNLTSLRLPKFTPRLSNVSDVLEGTKIVGMSVGLSNSPDNLSNICYGNINLLWADLSGLEITQNTFIPQPFEDTVNKIYVRDELSRDILSNKTGIPLTKIEAGRPPDNLIDSL